MSNRIYQVLDNGKPRLVEAATPAVAIQHCAVPRYVVTVASAKDVAELYEKGVKVEQVESPPRMGKM